MSHGEVELTLPATTPYLRLARLATITMAEDAGMGYTDVDDLRIALDELIRALMSAGGPALQLRVRHDGRCLRIDGRQPSSDAGPLTLTEVSARIVGVTADDYGLHTSTTDRSFWLEKLVTR